VPDISPADVQRIAEALTRAVAAGVSPRSESVQDAMCHAIDTLLAAGTTTARAHDAIRALFAELRPLVTRDADRIALSLVETQMRSRVLTYAYQHQPVRPIPTDAVRQP